jgi:hypothetical protein
MADRADLTDLHLATVREARTVLSLAAVHVALMARPPAAAREAGIAQRRAAGVAPTVRHRLHAVRPPRTRPAAVAVPAARAVDLVAADTRITN